MATKDLSYFVKREHKNTDKVNKRIANKSKEIEKILKQQEKVILDRIDKFYQDFGDTYGVSEEQAKKLVSQFDVDTFKERARKYVETKDTSYAANYDMRLYDTKQRISRLKLLLNEINLDIAEGYQKTSLVMNDILTTGQMKEMERQANLFKLPKNQVKTATEALLRETYTGTKFSSYWGKDLTNLYDILDTAIKGAVFNGQHPFQLKGRINKEFKTKDKWSKRLLITETTRMQSMVQIAAMKEAGYEYFRFIAEKSACDECGSYNNKVYSLEEWEKLVMIPPVHPHCRCSLVPATKEEYLSDRNWSKELGVEKEISNLINDVMQKSFFTGAQENKELLSLIDLNSAKLIHESKGTEDTVVFSKELKNLLKTAPKESLILNHNHPGEYTSSFSESDLLQLFSFNSIKQMTLVTSNKTQYYVNRKNKKANLFTKLKISNNYKSVYDKVVLGYSDEEIYANWDEISHEVNKKLSELLDYEYRRL